MFYKPDPKYVVQIVQYVYPTKETGTDQKSVRVYQHNLDDTHKRTGYDDIYGNDGGVFLRLIKIAHQNYHNVDEVLISHSAKKIDFVLSHDCNMLAISVVEGKQTFIKVLSCNDHKVTEMFENYKNKVFKYQY